MDDSSVRVSDADRDEAVAVLRPDAPAVRIRVIGFVGTIDVWRVLHDRRRELPA